MDSGLLSFRKKTIELVCHKGVLGFGPILYKLALFPLSLAYKLLNYSYVYVSRAIRQVKLPPKNKQTQLPTMTSTWLSCIYRSKLI